jgi:hypothetical protein
VGKRKPTRPPVCLECGQDAVLKTGADVYPHRPDLAGLQFWVCTCGARCGCHKGTDKPLGNPCGPETAGARSAAHREFDVLWQAKITTGATQKDARHAAYTWLAGQLELPSELTHISMMDRDTARRVVEICKPFADAIRQRRR